MVLLADFFQTPLDLIQTGVSLQLSANILIPSVHDVLLASSQVENEAVVGYAAKCLNDVCQAVFKGLHYIVVAAGASAAIGLQMQRDSDMVSSLLLLNPLCELKVEKKASPKPSIFDFVPERQEPSGQSVSFTFGNASYHNKPQTQ